MMKKQLVVLTGAGISAESGIKTFRDSDGLWENHNVMDVASIDGWYRNKELVLKFYNDRRRQLYDVEPNAAHFALATLEKDYNVTIVTQNVDDLHERGGSSNIIHLHGELRKSRSSLDENMIFECVGDINLGDKCPKGSQLRPHIVWFGENVPLIYEAAEVVASADIILVIGSSMQVYPAAGLVANARRDAAIYYIDPRPQINAELAARKNLKIIEEPATIGMQQILELLKIV
jgi:NAD-dependent deacetylase